LSSLFFDALAASSGASNSAAHTLAMTRRLQAQAPMPSDKPFFHDLRQPKKVITVQGEMLVRKECRCGQEFMARADQTKCKKCLEKKAKRK
jgi:hypothetical protein